MTQSAKKAKVVLGVRSQALACRANSRLLSGLSNEDRQKILGKIADSLIDNTDAILEVNKLDIEAAKQMDMADAMRKRLVMSKQKIQTLAAGIRQIAADSDPIGTVMKKTLLADGLELQQVTVPIGVLMIIFESRPDCLPQIAALAIRSGNGLILKGGKEASRSCAFLHKLIVDAIETATKGNISGALIALVQSRQEVKDLLALDDVIDLCIPRGGGALVRFIQQNTKIPVMGHAEGICHVFVDAKADLAKAIRVVVDAKVDYPAACNAMETLLIHRALAPHAPAILKALKEAGVSVLGGPKAVKELGLDPVKSFKEEYGNLTCGVELVDDVEEAIVHIHRYGSGHTEAILTEDPQTALRFLNGVDAACVFHNASTRFADGFRFGLGAEVGISTGRIHARGPVGVEGLTTTKWKMVSQHPDGDTAADFSQGKRTFLHRPMPLK